MMRRKLLVCLPLILLLLCLQPVNAYWSDLEDEYGPLIKIGLLVCYDSEYAAFNNHHLWPAHAKLREATEFFAAHFGIEFTFDHYDDWILWDSYEAPFYFADDLLQDAIDKTGFESGKVINGKVRDMLLALTGKEILGGMGWRWPPWDACIVQYTIFGGHLDEIFQHELCIFVPDCPDPDCVMNAGILSHFDPPNVWCEDCFQQINPQKFRYTVTGDVDGNHIVNLIDLNQAEARVGSHKGDDDWAASCDINGNHAIDTIDTAAISAHLGETAPGYHRFSISRNHAVTYCRTTPPTGDHAYPQGSSVIVTATADNEHHYEFRYFSVDGTRIYQNPITVTMNGDHVIVAYFKYEYGGGGGDIYLAPVN